LKKLGKNVRKKKMAKLPISYTDPTQTVMYMVDVWHEDKEKGEAHWKPIQGSADLQTAQTLYNTVDEDVTVRIVKWEVISRKDGK
jgi:hypothetical protein